MHSQADTGARAAQRLKICLAASGGGHLRQLLDLQPVWSAHDYFFVTEDTALGQTLARDHRTAFLPHFAWGQAKMGAPVRMIWRAARSAVRALKIMLRERPDLVISTGAGAVIFPVIWGRLFGARIVVIESFARFDHPSLFGRIAAPLAHELVVQSDKLLRHYPRANVFDPLRMLDGQDSRKDEFLFATVGATLPFDRLVDAVGELKAQGHITEDVLIQTGVGGHVPAGAEVVETLPFDKVQEVLRRAKIVVCHGGTGSLITALREGCQVIAMPRLSRLGEHYDDHQSEITEAFSQRGLVLVANSVEELQGAITAARQRKPVRATTEPEALIGFLRAVIEKLAATKRR